MQSRRHSPLASLAIPLLTAILLACLALAACVTTPVGYESGKALAASGDHTGAVAAFGQSVAADPLYAPAYLARAKSFMALGQDRQALDDYAKAAELTPQDKGAWLGQALAERHLGLHAAAASHYAHAAALDPADLDARVDLAISLNMAGRHEDAAKAYAQAAELAPDPATKRWMTGSQAASLALAGQCDLAIPLFSQVLASDPSDTDARLVRGLCLAETGQHETALEDFSALLAADPKDGQALFSRGRSLAALGRAKEAVADFAAVAALDPAKAEELRGQYLSPKGVLKALTRAGEGKADADKLLPVMECFAGQMLDKDMPGCRPLLDGLK